MSLSLWNAKEMPSEIYPRGIRLQINHIRKNYLIIKTCDTPHRYSGRRHDLVASSVIKVSCLLKPKQWVYKADLQHAYHYKKKIWKGVSEGILWRGVFHACLHRHWLLHSLNTLSHKQPGLRNISPEETRTFCSPKHRIWKIKGSEQIFGVNSTCPSAEGGRLEEE